MAMEPEPSDSIRGLPDGQRLELLIDAVTDYAICLLDVDGTIGTWNAGAERATGYRPAEIVGRHFTCFFTAEETADGLPARMLAEARDAGRAEHEGWLARKDGGRFWATDVIQPVRADGALSVLLGSSATIPNNMWRRPRFWKPSGASAFW